MSRRSDGLLEMVTQMVYDHADEADRLHRDDDSELTREWWAEREEFDLYTSRLVVQGCQEGDVDAAADRLAVLTGIPIVGDTATTNTLAEELVRSMMLPKRAAADAVHVAIAATQGMEYLLTWNCTHLANASLRGKIEAACRAAGCEPPLICTPPELPTKGMKHG
jgi:hypothetical protein